MGHFVIRAEPSIAFEITLYKCELIEDYGNNWGESMQKAVESLTIWNFSGQCECKTSCKETGPTVCGTDNVTYASECHLSVRSLN
uniref:Kazal-like domain-containing protein n=1 Tax=Parascaris equorum TaxID=6256 RepID=A0A914S6S8_PAREQ